MTSPKTCSGSTRRLSGGTVRTGLASIAPSSMAYWKIRSTSDRQCATVDGPTSRASCACQRRTSAGVILSIGRSANQGRSGCGLVQQPPQRLVPQPQVVATPQRLQLGPTQSPGSVGVLPAFGRKRRIGADPPRTPTWEDNSSSPASSTPWDTPTMPPGRVERRGLGHRLAGADALQHGVGADPVRPIAAMMQDRPLTAAAAPAADVAGTYGSEARTHGSRLAATWQSSVVASLRWHRSRPAAIQEGAQQLVARGGG